MPPRILLDTNVLLMPFQFRLNLQAELKRLFGEVDLVVPSPVMDELRLLAEGDRDALGALRLAETFGVVEAAGSADDALIDLGVRWKAPVATNDAALLERLRAAGVPRVFLRSRNHLVVEGL